MKIRNGFVSNSSSSSFVIYGICVELDEILEKIKPTLSEEDYDSIKDGDCSLEDYWKNELSLYQDYESDSVYIGREWSSIGDDETGRQFKEHVNIEISKIIENKTPRTINGEISC